MRYSNISLLLADQSERLGILLGLCIFVSTRAMGMNAEIDQGHISDADQFEEHMGGKYYADLGWRTSAGVSEVLSKAKEVLLRQPNAKIEILVHGKDMRLFVDSTTRYKPTIVEDSIALAASENVTFRVCDHALVYKNMSLDLFPRHFGTVDYVPERVHALRDAEYLSLHGPDAQED